MIRVPPRQTKFIPNLLSGLTDKESPRSCFGMGTFDLMPCTFLEHTFSPAFLTFRRTFFYQISLCRVSCQPENRRLDNGRGDAPHTGCTDDKGLEKSQIDREESAKASHVPESFCRHWALSFSTIVLHAPSNENA